MKYLFIAFGLSLALNIYFLTSSKPAPDVVHESEEVTQKLKSKQSSVRKITSKKASSLNQKAQELFDFDPKKAQKERPKKVQSELEPHDEKPANDTQEIERTIDDITYQDWHEEVDRKIQMLFTEQMELSEEDYNDYLSLRDDFQRDSEKFFAPPMEDENAPEDKVYIPSFEENLKYFKLLSKYQEQLRVKLGEVNYVKYRKFVESHNNRPPGDDRAFYIINF